MQNLINLYKNRRGAMETYAAEMHLPFYKNTITEKIYPGELYNKKFHKGSNAVPSPVSSESVIKAFGGEIVSDSNFFIIGSIY